MSSPGAFGEGGRGDGDGHGHHTDHGPNHEDDGAAGAAGQEGGLHSPPPTIVVTPTERTAPADLFSDRRPLMLDADGDANDGPNEDADYGGPTANSTSIAVCQDGTYSTTFVPLLTIPMSISGIVANLIMIVLVFLLPILCESKDTPVQKLCPLEPFSILVYSHSGHWVLHLIADQFLKQQHKKSRVAGYIEFYLSTKNIRRTPFYLVSVGNAVLLITVTALHDYCDPNNCKDRFMKVDYLRGLITLECLIIICLWVSYIIHVREFHSNRALPDVLREDVMRQLLVHGDVDLDHPNNAEGTAPVILTQTQKDEVLEKQAELIRHLQSHIENLNGKLVTMAQQLRDTERI